jgi:hypothetical protein
MLTGRYAEGWPRWGQMYLESSRLRLGLKHLIGHMPYWTGEQLAGRLHLESYGGPGDGFMMLRWVPLIRDRVGALTVSVTDPVAAFLAEQFPDVDVKPHSVSRSAESLSTCEAWTHTFALPALCGCTSPADVPPAPYLQPTRPRAPLPGRFKVGLAWAGAASNPEDVARSSQLAEWASVLAVEGITFYSLMAKNPAADQVDQFRDQVTDLRDELRDWEDTAAALMEVDLIIAVDCSVANLAGALGRPLWICLPALPEWRWTLDRRDCHWYGSARLFRQPRIGDWGSVFQEVARELQALVS